ncbi:ISAs1 family transposase [Pilimelia columellifera]|uniref:H repeat-associated protein N-terminal domain-containing protein n=1 Tax=Pilimelia columellifera subsp. columellifera TaxID=706583 RepID=A0ABP6B0E1_9ACTN
MIYRFLHAKIASGAVLVSSSSLISPAVDHLADLALREAELAVDTGCDAGALSLAAALVQRLRQVPDPRRTRGRRHSLVVILALTACATLVVGNDSVAAIWQWAARTPQEVHAWLGARYHPWSGRYAIASERAFRRVLTRLDGDALDAALGGYAADVTRGRAPVPQIPKAPGPAEGEQRRAATRSVTCPVPAGLLPAAALDGKLLHGSVTATGKVFLVAAVTHDRGTVLGQRQVADKRGETTATAGLLAGLDVAEMVLAMDALHTTNKTARLITEELHAHYVPILKGNQPLAFHTAQALPSGADTAFADQTAVETDRGHGRTERRAIRAAACDDTLFPSARPAGVPAPARRRRPRRGPDQQRDRSRRHQPAQRSGRTSPPQPLLSF